MTHDCDTSALLIDAVFGDGAYSRSLPPSTYRTMESHDILVDTLKAVRSQEEETYRKTDGWKNSLEQNPLSEITMNTTPIDEDCRIQIAAWYCRFLQTCQLETETVEIALSLLDRYTAMDKQARTDRRYYQLVSLASLYTAIKVHAQSVVSAELVSRLSAGTFSADQVKEMERTMLGALDWHVNPPTSISILRLLTELIIAKKIVVDDEQTRTTLFDISKVQLELAWQDPSLSKTRASTLAVASLLNTLESLGLPYDAIQTVFISQTSLLELDSSKTVQVRDRLYHLFSSSTQAGSCQQGMSNEPAKASCAERDGVEISPRTVQT